SIRPMRSTSSATWAGSETSQVSRSTPWTVAPCSASAFAMAAPMPPAVPVTSATRPERSGIAPAVLEDVPHLFDARLPDAQHVLVGPLVGAAEGAVAEQFPHLVGIDLANGRDVDHRLPLPRLLDARQARPREVLEPRGVARVRVDRLYLCPRARRVPPVVPDDLRLVVLGLPGVERAATSLVAPVAVDQQEAAEALAVERVDDVAEDGAVRLGRE